MKRWLLFILCAGLAAGAAFMITRWACAEKSLPLEDQLKWLKAEFRLTEEQAAEIQVLHDNYLPVCRTHCEKIREARKAAEVAAKNGGGGEAGAKALEAARAELRRVEAVCQDATRAHLLRVAAVMEPAQGERFKSLVLPKLGNHNHEAPCELR
jgi:hypothetical protein